MFSWFKQFSLFNNIAINYGDNLKSEHTNAFSKLIDTIGSSEANILVISGRKYNNTVLRLIDLIKSIYNAGYHFDSETNNNTNNNASLKDTISKLSYNSLTLEQILLSQKVSLNNYDTPPSLLIFDKCLEKRDPTYHEIIKENRELRFSTLTIIEDLYDIDSNLVHNMDILILFKDRKKGKLPSYLKYLWEKSFKGIISFDKFNEYVSSSLDAMTAAIVTKDGIYSMKICKNQSNFYNICLFHHITDDASP